MFPGDWPLWLHQQGLFALWFQLSWANGRHWLELQSQKRGVAIYPSSSLPAQPVLPLAVFLLFSHSSSSVGPSYTTALPRFRQMTMASPAVSPWGLHHPSLVTLTFPHPLSNSLQSCYLSISSLSCQDPWLRQKLNFLLQLAQLNVVKLGLGILAVWLQNPHFTSLSTLVKAPNKATNDTERGV